MEGDEAAVEQLRRSYDVAGSEALRRKFEEQNSADEAQIEEMRALLHTWRNEGKTEAEAELISSMQPIYSRIKRRSKMLRALRDLHKNFAKQVKSGEMDRVAMEALRGMRSTAAAARKRPASALKQAGGEGAKKRRTEETSPTGAVKLERGKHLKEKPHMPQTARAGQKRWKEMLEKMRDEAKASTPNKEFAKQMAELIRAGKFCDARDTERGFIGWTSFTIDPASASSFYRRVQDLFGEDSEPKTNTIHSIFRRAGLVPQEWNKGWDGHVPFVYGLKNSAADRED